MPPTPEGMNITPEMAFPAASDRVRSGGEALAAASAHGSAETSVICSDLDGTLLRSDSLLESFLLLIKSRPAILFLIPLWWLRGKAFLKHEIARRTSLNPATLPYREDLLDFLRKRKESGKEVVLVTGSDRKIADAVANHLGIFSAVLASDGKTNLVGQAKLLALRELLGNKDFDYVGNGRADLAVWRAAKTSFVVSSSGRLLRKVRQVGAVGQVFSPGRGYVRSVLAALRVHHWAKNILVFVPLILAHKIFTTNRLLPTILAFCSFCLLASTGYIINDLFDLEADRVHAVKKYRPIASGALPVWLAAIIASVLMLGILSFTWFALAPQFAALLTLYFVCSVLYSQFLKRMPVVDVLVLAGLYTLRVLAGGVVADAPVSRWLLGFSMFFFLSLAFVKRFSEMLANGSENQRPQNGRGYYAPDRDLFRTVGPVSGYISVLVFALYINSPEVAVLYTHPQYLWFLGPLLLFWITRIWLLAERGEMDQDPVVFAIRDRASYIVGLLALLIVFASI